MVHLDGIIGNEINLDSIAAITNNGDRELSLTTVGGSLLYGKGMYDYATANNSFDTIHCFGIVASAGTIFLLAAKNRIASPNAKFLIHPPTGRAEGDAREMQKTATLLSDEENWLVAFYVEKLGKDEAFIKNLMLQNKVLNASEARELGLITEILNFEPMENVTKKDLETFENSFFQKIKNFFNPKNKNGLGKELG
jgi:ATP-dependent Clp protease protease subunit